MFCERCGAQLSNTAEFCANCGNKIYRTRIVAEGVPDTTVQLKVKPTFKFIYMVLPSLLAVIFIILFFALTLATVMPIVGICMGLIGGAILAIYQIISTLLKKKQYDNYTYDFYKTKVIYRDSYIDLSEKEIKYKYIREIAMRQTFGQRLFNLGNIILYTTAGSGLISGVFMTNIENVEEVYHKIKEIVDKGTSGEF